MTTCPRCDGDGFGPGGGNCPCCGGGGQVDDVTPDIETLIERLEDPERYVDAIDDAITALRAVQWRPISEAPKDGTPVLGRSGAHYREVRWLARGWHDNDDNEWWPDEFMPLPEG